VYTKTVSLKQSDLANTRTITLDFGKGTPIVADPAIKNDFSRLNSNLMVAAD